MSPGGSAPNRVRFPARVPVSPPFFLSFPLNKHMPNKTANKLQFVVSHLKSYSSNITSGVRNK